MNEDDILNMYLESINSVRYHSLLCLRLDESLGIEVVSKCNIEKDTVISQSNIYPLTNHKLVDKYASYVWNDMFVITGLGMLLNNKDKFNSENCDFDWKKEVFRTTTRIEKNTPIRLDYRMKSDGYPPIPKEIINLRNKMI